MLPTCLLAPPVQLQGFGPSDGAAPGSPAPASSSASLHLSAAAVLLASWWFLQQDIPGLQRKLFTTFLFPVGCGLGLSRVPGVEGPAPLLSALVWHSFALDHLWHTPLLQLSYLYITKGLLDRTRCSALTPIYCACWFLVGFATGEHRRRWPLHLLGAQAP